jgi:hypothetical protein
MSCSDPGPLPGGTLLRLSDCGGTRFDQHETLELL